jgi:hypothetical protein
MKTLPAVILGVGALATGTAVYTHKFAAKDEPSASESEPSESVDSPKREE